MTVCLNTICPHCGKRHDRTSLLENMAAERRPKNKDVTMCFGCGQFSVFDWSVEGGLRKPSRRETRDILRMPRAVEMAACWLHSVEAQGQS